MKKEDRDSDVSEIIPKDICDKEKEELWIVKKRIEVLEQMTLLCGILECVNSRDNVTMTDVLRELLQKGKVNKEK